jgi:4-hydroxy-tetrahydrodipicolinate synthase
MKSKPTMLPLGNFHGVFSALVTPMKASGEMDHACLGALADHQIRQGLHGLIPLGSTGEMPRMTALMRLCGDQGRMRRTTADVAAVRRGSA